MTRSLWLTQPKACSSADRPEGVGASDRVEAVANQVSDSLGHLIGGEVRVRDEAALAVAGVAVSGGELTGGFEHAEAKGLDAETHLDAMLTGTIILSQESCPSRSRMNVVTDLTCANGLAFISEMAWALGLRKIPTAARSWEQRK